MRAALYARVSTVKQDPAPQLDQLRAYAAVRGWTVAAEFVDLAQSGVKQMRPQLDALMLAAEQKAFDVVLVYKFDRLARSMVHLHSAVESFTKNGVIFASVSEAVDTGTPIGKLLLSILGSIANFERDLIIERTNDGRNAARAKLERRGSYRRPKDGKLVTSLGRPRSAVIDMERVHTMLASGMSRNAVAKALNVPETTLRDRLKGERNAPNQVNQPKEAGIEGV